ncbi:MAG: GTPase domain-containing protein [Zavarzinella sp.]|nr:GTPase domain-containing protein [Zavarzinella sp.]
MSAPSPPPASPVAVDPSAVRLVLFGMPDAGKSSLLGALAQAAHTQGRALHGRLTDVTHGLGELRNRVYDDRQRETLEEIVPYPVVFDPYGATPEPAVLYDCDGRAANDFLTSKRSLEKEGRAGALAQAILSADALILTVDASAPPTQIDDDFREFLRFLRYLHQYRTREHAVGGLPVYLVLTKCDLLGRETMTRAAWEARIQEKQQEVVKRFKQFLGDEAEPGDMFAFGTLDVDVRATAVRHPALADAGPLPREPFGVAELFHEAFEDARVFHDRRSRSQKRLRWTVAGAGGFLVAMAVAGLIFVTTKPVSVEPTLADRVEALRATEGPTAATRLGPGLDNRLREWLKIQSEPGFPGLSDELQGLVLSRIEEGQAYVQFRDELAAIPPERARSLAELAQTESRLQKLTPPPAFVAEWAPTDAATQRDRLLRQEIPGLRAAVGKLTQFYYGLANRATGLLQATELTPEWEQAVRGVENSATAFPVPKSDPAVGIAHDYDDVGVAEADWQRTRDRLVRVRDLAMALGVLGDASGPRAPLALAPPPPDAKIPELASRRLQNLKTYYPDASKWSLALVPDTIRPELERPLRRSIDQANRDGQRLILDRLMSLNTSGREEPADWPRVGEYLLSPPLQDWRELVAFLNRLADPTAEDPVQATAAFLRRTTFDIDPRRLRLRIPDTLSDAPVRPAGDFTLVYRRAERGDPVRVALRPEGEPQRDKQSLVYTFSGSGPGITYRPGDRLYAELPVRKGDRELRLTWSRARAESFQFESLQREPRLHAPDQNYLEGVIADGVTVAITDGKFPIVPPMVPAVRFEKK